MAALIAGVLAVVLLPLIGPAAPAGATPEQFTFSMTSGELLIRDATEAAEIGLPTTVSGTNTDGQLSGIDFVTPTISFRRDVPQYGTYADIDAAFSMVEPGSGSINEDGDVVVEVAVAVDLHIVVPILAFPTDCRAAPVRLQLVSTAPYDGESVTLAASNFTVPAVPFTASCDQLVGGAVNDALSGSGHAISMTLAGDVTLPVAGEPTVTTLAMTPEGGARVGQEVTLSVTVAPEVAPEEPVDLPGLVTFYDGSTVLGSVSLAIDGTASLTTTGLSAGTRRLRAAYSGAPPDWRPSSSPVSDYVVSAAPLVSTDLSGGLIIGGAAKDFTVSVRNTDLGAALDDVRLNVRIMRPQGISGGSLNALTLDHVVAGVPVSVPLTSVLSERRGSIGGDVWAVPPGQTRTETLRLTAPAGMGPQPLLVVFELVTMDDELLVPLSSATGNVTLTAEDRFVTSIKAGVPARPPVPPRDPGAPAVPPVTPVARQGVLVEVYALDIGPAQGGLAPRGTVSFRVGGRPALARFAAANSLVAWAPMVRVPAGVGPTFHVVVPSDAPLGDQLVTVQYSGDDVYAGSSMSWPVRIEPGLGEVYDCVYTGIARGRFLAGVEVQAQTPRVGVKGTSLGVERVDARLRMSRTRSHVVNAARLDAPSATFDFELTGGGAGAFESLAQTGTTAMDTAGTPPVDWMISLGQGSGSLPVAHDAGTALDVGLESLVFDASQSSFTFLISCLPFEASALVGAEVTSTGTSLTVNPEGPVRQGATVELTAQALPVSPGTVEFLDGETSVGVAPVDGLGIARVIVEGLAPGTRSLTARYFGTVYPDSTSDPVEFTVEAIDCIDFAETGSAAVVRLIYLTVLNRCPDQAGFEFWVERLDGGTTREAVANAIAASHEARKVLVDEAYELMLGRRADAAGREHWATRLGQTGSYRDLIGHLGSSPEFRSLAGGTDAGVVARLFDRLLHRTPSADDSAFWVGQIQARGTRATVIKMFDLDEPLRTLVGGTYRDLVDRAPTTPERDAGVDLMRSSSDRSALNASVINSNDFYTRAQGFPNP